LVTSKIDINATLIRLVNFKIDYADPATLENALEGCDVLVNAMGTNGDHESNKVALVDIAAKVGVKVYIPSEFGVDPHVDSEFIRHPMWQGKKAHDKYAESKGLKVISIYNGLFMEHPHGGFQAFHGFYPERQAWYVPGDGTTPISITSKTDIGRSIIELVTMASETPERVPSRIRLAGTSRTPKEIVDIFNLASKGKTYIKLIPLSDEESKVFMNKDNMKPPPGLPKDFDLNYIYDVASRVFRMAGSGGNLDFSQRNDNELVNPGESKWKWKTIESYAEEVEGMPREDVFT